MRSQCVWLVFGGAVDDSLPLADGPVLIRARPDFLYLLEQQGGSRLLSEWKRARARARAERQQTANAYQSELVEDQKSAYVRRIMWYTVLAAKRAIKSDLMFGCGEGNSHEWLLDVVRRLLTSIPTGVGS